MGFGFSKAQEAELERQAIERGGSVTKPARLNDPWLGPIELRDAPASSKTRGQSSKLAPKVANHATPPCQSLWVPNWTPGLINQWDGSHWTRRAKIKKADKEIVAVYFHRVGLTTAEGPRRVSMLFVLPKGKRMFDRDAPFKSCLDALVYAKALVNDSPKWCVHGPVSYARAIGAESAVGTLILLEDL